jgi:hypothetical protein
MLRIILGVIAGFFSWIALWFGFERVLSAIWPAFGAQQHAFQATVESGGSFAPETSFLLTHIVCASIVSLLSGFIAALIAGENKRAPLILGFLLVAMGLLKVAWSWPLVPVWYHVIFTAVLLPMIIVGGKLRPAR